MAVGAAVAAIAGTAFTLHNQSKQAKAQERQLKQTAEAKEKQAFELLRRAEFNIDQLQRETEKFKARQQGSLIRGGLAGGSQLSLILLEQTNSEMLDSAQAQREEAKFKATTLLSGADIDTRLAGDVAGALPFAQGATLLQGAGAVASKFPSTGGGAPKTGGGTPKTTVGGSNA